MSRTVADLVADQLAAWGVKAVYGVPGDAVLPFIDAVRRHPRLNFYGVKHETAAAFMASARAKLTGEIGVCTGTSGPGTANLINGLADAKNDRAPVLAVTGQVETYNLATNYKQYVDQGMLLASLADYSGMIVTAEQANDVVVKALRSVVTGRTPAHFSVAMDIWSQNTEDPVRPFEPFLQTQPQSAPEIIKEAIRLLNEAERPAILAGRGVGRSGGLVVSLAEKWQSGIALTMPAKGMLSGAHPLVLGGLGEGGSAASTTMLNEADMILIIGATWWPESYLSFPGRIVQLDAAPENIGRNVAVSYGIVGNSERLLPEIIAGITVQDKKDWLGRLAQLKREWLDRIAVEITTGETPVPPGRLIKTLEETIEKDAVVTLDVGDHTVWFNRIFSGTNQTVIISGNWRSTGFGLPAALAAKQAAPERQVVALVGDGGMAQSMAEFSTAVRYRLPVTIVVANNGYLAMEKGKMQLQQMDYEVTSLTNPDFAKFAEICGGKGYRVENAGELKNILTAAVNCGEPAIVDVITAAPVFPGAADKEVKKKTP